MIPMVALGRQHAALRQELDAAFEEVLGSGHFVLGPQMAAFEGEAARYLGVEHAIGCASGTDALHLSLAALGISAGDEVITTPFTFAATAEAIRYRGATPVFVDIRPDSFNIDIAAVASAITPATKAVMPVHLFGQPADMEELCVLCEAHDLRLIEDCAQSFGACFGVRQTGTFGNTGCFSFFPSKNLGALGDGGLIVCRNEELASRLRMLRNHGSRERYFHEILGFNSRLDDIQAAFLRTKLKHIDRFNAERRRAAHTYTRLLEGSGVKTPVELPGRKHVYHQYTILSDRRDRIAARLKEADIASAIYYPVPLHRQAAFVGDARSLDLPVTDDIASRCLSLPIFPELTDDEIEGICRIIRSVAG
jgi:dTDP-4-amino-4,6-dideoxygalactose transaminase